MITKLYRVECCGYVAYEDTLEAAEKLEEYIKEHSGHSINIKDATGYIEGAIDRLGYIPDYDWRKKNTISIEKVCNT